VVENSQCKPITVVALTDYSEGVTKRENYSYNAQFENNVKIFGVPQIGPKSFSPMNTFGGIYTKRKTS